MNTFSDKIFHYAYYLRIRSVTAITTFFYVPLLRLRGIRIGGKAKFVGLPFIYKYPGSTIVFGRNIEVRTLAISNLIGLNRRTMISTHSEKARIEIGDHCGMSGTVIGAKEFIKIGRNVMIGANALITDFDWHSLDSKSRNAGMGSGSKPVIIQDNVFIGTGVTILKGVEIGKNSVIGAQSVVASSIPDNVIAAGNPCRVISEAR